jgi:hypothetical protein
MNEILHSLLLFLSSAFFAVAALIGIKDGRLPSMRGGRVERKNGPVIFYVCVVLYLSIAAILLLGALFWRR